jgi:hypothetical protein
MHDALGRDLLGVAPGRKIMVYKYNPPFVLFVVDTVLTVSFFGGHMTVTPVDVRLLHRLHLEIDVVVPLSFHCGHPRFESIVIVATQQSAICYDPRVHV